MKKVIELIRVSTESQADETRASIPTQHAINRRTEQTFGLEIVYSITIIDVSGARILAAPEMQDLLRRMESPEIHGVVCYAFNRLMRPENYADYAILQAFVDTKTVLYLPSGLRDFSSRSGRLLGTIEAAMAGQDRLDFLANVWNAKEEKRHQGEFPQSAVCLPTGVGYDRAKGKKGWHYTGDAEKVRAAFRLMLAGNTSYWEVGRIVGIEPPALRNILRNPIYTGWRVITEQRDHSSNAQRVKAGGRQGDRPKIKRDPDKVVRVRVISEPLVSEEDFNRLQQILELKNKRHWRSRPDYKHRFTYNGFLLCGVCGQLVYTKYRRRDYYLCKARKQCGTHYMRKDKLESKLDELFSARLTDEGFIREFNDETVRRFESRTDHTRIARLEATLGKLENKRERIKDAFFDGEIERPERDSRLAGIEREVDATRELLLKERPPEVLSAQMLSHLFAPFKMWEFLKRDDKRQILSTITPDIRVADYRVHGLYINLPRGTDVNHTDTDSSPPRA